VLVALSLAAHIPLRPPTLWWRLFLTTSPFRTLRTNAENTERGAFEHIFVIDPSDRSVSEWRGALVETENLAGIPAARIWHELDLQYDSDLSH